MPSVLLSTATPQLTGSAGGPPIALLLCVAEDAVMPSQQTEPRRCRSERGDESGLTRHDPAQSTSLPALKRGGLGPDERPGRGIDLLA